MVRRVFVVLAAVVAVLVGGFGPAYAGVSQGGLVSEHPVRFTPNVLDGSVAAMAVVGDVVVVGGEFSSVADTGGTRYARRNLMAYRLSTGQVLPFAAQLDGPVAALAAGPGGTVYAGGSFSRVDGAAHVGLVQLDVSTGRPVAGFTTSASTADVRALAAHGPWLYVGGAFDGIGGRRRTALARLATQSGAVDPGFDLRLAGARTGPVKVVALAITNDGSRVAVAGSFTTAGGTSRPQLLLVDGASGRLSSWFTDAYAPPCTADYGSYLRAVDFSPSGAYLAVVTSGHLSGPVRMCDTAARLDATGAGTHPPVWVNHTGGNTLLSVAVTDGAVYIGGHQQWVDNPYGQKTAGPGAIARPGIAALDPATGHALTWNPTHSRGNGIEALVTCPAGLLVGSDTDELGHAYHGRIGMLPTR